MSTIGRSYTPEERATWEAENGLPPPVLRLDALRYQRRAREHIAERETRIVERRTAPRQQGEEPVPGPVTP